MKDYTFKVPQDIVFGVGSLQRLPELLEKCGSKKMMVVSDRGLEKLGVVKKVIDIVEANGIETSVFLDILPNPTVDMVDAATKMYKESGATSIVALGGGSPMDVAKAVEDVKPFIKNIDNLNLWNKEFFIEITNKLK